MKKLKILFKYASRNNGYKFVNVINNITSKVSDRDNYVILVSADKDDPMMYNREVLTYIKDHIDSGKVVICFDKSESKAHAINRDMQLISDYDIIVCISDEVNFSVSGFDEQIRNMVSMSIPDLNGKTYYDAGERDVLIITKKYYETLGYIYDPNKKHNLFVNYYQDKNEDRTKELNFSLFENLKNEKINNVVLISTEVDYLKLKYICDNDLFKKIIPVITDKRPTFNDYFRLTKKLFNSYDNVNIIANLDIIIPLETISNLSNYLTTNNTCLALTRWDINNGDDYKNNSTFFDRADSQDCWMFNGGVEQIYGADFTLGICGCDNVSAHLLEQKGYNVINPSRTIKTYHLHLVQVRNYMNQVGIPTERLSPPYKILAPTE